VFYSCSGLTSVTIDNSTIKIDPNVFNFCSNLKDIIIPAGSLSRFQEMLISGREKLKVYNDLHY